MPCGTDDNCRTVRVVRGRCVGLRLDSVDHAVITTDKGVGISTSADETATIHAE